MEQEKIFINFLNLVLMYSRERNDIGFYAHKLSISPDELCTVINDMSDQDFEYWLDIMKKWE